MLRIIRNHAVICGLGRKGAQLVRDFRERGISVVALELDGNRDYVSYCLNLGAYVLVGSAGDTALLRMAAVQRAQVIVAISGDDGVNVDSMLKIHSIIKDSRDKHTRRSIGYVHVVDYHLSSLFKTHTMTAGKADRFKIRVINIHAATARLLFDERPLDYRPIGPTDPHVPHLICIGLGKTGEAVVVQAARIGHYANGHRLRITAVDLVAETKETVLHGRHGWIREVCDLEFINGDIANETVPNELRKRFGHPNTLHTIVICMNDDSLNLKAALHLHAFFGRPPIPIYVRMMDDPHQARLAHTFHNAVQSADTPLFGDDDCRPWDELPEIRRDAFCLQADHLPVMLRGVGLELVEVDGSDSIIRAFSVEEIETLARMEYQRRLTDRLLAAHNGMAQAPQDASGLIRGVWKQLDPEMRCRYEKHVSALPAILGKDGLGIRRIAAPQSGPASRPS